MSPESERLSELSTSWTLLRQAHDPKASERDKTDARGTLVQRYEYVIRTYLGGAFRQLGAQRQEAVEECYSRFCLRLAEGRFARADPAKGRFRDFLCKALRNLATDYLRERKKGAVSLGEREVPAPGPKSEERDFNELFAENLVDRAMAELRRLDDKKSRPYYSVLSVRIAHPQWSAEQIAAELSAAGAARSAGWVRINLWRARAELCKLLRQEVALELDGAGPAAVDEELSTMGLLAYCQ